MIAFARPGLAAVVLAYLTFGTSGRNSGHHEYIPYSSTIRDTWSPEQRRPRHDHHHHHHSHVGEWSSWSVWSYCSRTCGIGVKTRSRACVKTCNDSLEHKHKRDEHDAVCSGDSMTASPCQVADCSIAPVDGGWGMWQHWTSCSQSCGHGMKTRQRSCDNPAPAHGGNKCIGLLSMSSSCQLTECPIDGGWGSWEQWTSCSHSCGHSVKTRHRSCDNPTPKHGGNICHGYSSMTSNCHLADCPTLQAPLWSDWTVCSATCGGGSTVRVRFCGSGQNSCVGLLYETKTCGTGTCAPSRNTNGGWSQWTNWSHCDVTCGHGYTMRSRTCTNPVPAGSGAKCTGSAHERHLCHAENCANAAVDGGWGTWDQWTSCSQSCGLGVTERRRSCNSPAPKNGGNPCIGVFTTSAICQLKDCPTDGGWGDWASWTSCDATCGSGLETRTRICDNPAPERGGKDCTGISFDLRTCNMSACPIAVDGGWTTFTTFPCNATCGAAVAIQYRSCTNPSPAFGGKDCVGPATDLIPCNYKDCDIDGGWSQWTDWANCDVMCGRGHKMRSKACTSPAPAGSGANCTGSAHERLPCHTGNCSNASRTCFDDDIMQVAKANPYVVGAIPSPATTCSWPESQQELILSKICHVTTTSLNWTLGTQLSGNCEKAPLFSPVALIDKQTQSRKYGILLDCYQEVIQIVDFSCRMKVQVIPLNHTVTDHHVLLM